MIRGSTLEDPIVIETYRRNYDKPLRKKPMKAVVSPVEKVNAELKHLFDLRIKEHEEREAAMKFTEDIRRIVSTISSLQTKRKKLDLAISIQTKALLSFKKEYLKAHPLDKELAKKIRKAKAEADRLWNKSPRPYRTMEERALWMGLPQYKAFSKENREK